MNKLKLAALLVAALLTGCAATVQRPADAEPALDVSPTAARKIVLVVTGSDIAEKSADWQALRGEWRTAMANATAAAQLDFDYQEKPARTREPATVVVVKVNDYRYLSAGARYGLGIMTGNAFMDADVRFLDAQTGRPAGTRQYKTSSSAWQGIFSAMTAKQLEAISTEIVTDVAKR